MVQAVDLSTLGKDDQEALAAMADQHGVGADDTPRTEVTTAFVTIQKADGTWESTADLSVAGQIATQRVALADDLYAGASVLLKDIAAIEAAGQVQMAMMQMTQAAMQRQQSQQILQQVSPNLRR